jgi:hypothetical protein
MVRGLSTAVTSVAGGNQCADTDRMLCGRGIDFPIAAHPSVKAFRSMAFIGLP